MQAASLRLLSTYIDGIDALGICSAFVVAG
jgi:hypothetical protein